MNRFSVLVSAAISLARCRSLDALTCSQRKLPSLLHSRFISALCRAFDKLKVELVMQAD